MKRILTATAFAAALVAMSAAPASAGPIVEPGGQCNGTVDVLCRDFVCGPDDLDCGMVPFCLVWVARTGCLL